MHEPVQSAPGRDERDPALTGELIALRTPSAVPPDPASVLPTVRPADNTEAVSASVLRCSLEDLASASAAISASLDAAEVLRALLTQTVLLLKVPAVSVSLRGEDGEGGVRIAAAHGLSDTYREQYSGALEQRIVGRALAGERRFAAGGVHDVADPEAERVLRQEGIEAAACAPMFFAGRPLGSLNLYTTRARPFDQDQFHILSLLAAQGAVALSNARAFTELNAQAAQVRASFERVGTALASSLDVSETLKLIVQLAGEMTRAEATALFMIQTEQEGGGMTLAAARGIDRRSIRRFRRLPLSPLARHAVQERRTMVVPDARHQTDTAFPILHSSYSVSPEVRSAICVPVFVNDEPVAVLEQYAAHPDRFDRNETQLLTGFALHAAVAIENARLYTRERGIAQTLQQAFLPTLPMHIGGFQVGRIYAPGSAVAAIGGDTYDLFTLPDGRIMAVIADVSGQGTVAATLAIMAKYTLRAYALEDPNPAALVARINNAIVHQTGDSVFLTLCCALIDPVSRRFQLVSAAHPPALLCRARTGECRTLGDTSGLIVGFLSNETYHAEDDQFEPGDVLVFYTDGVTEARQQKVMFEIERLKAVIVAHAHHSAQEIASAIYTAVADYTAGNLSDDVALLVLKAG